MEVEDLFMWAAMIFVGIAVGNLLGDVATYRDCAKTGSAYMTGSGKITCEVVKGPKP